MLRGRNIKSQSITILDPFEREEGNARIAKLSHTSHSIGKLGSWEVGKLGSWEVGKLGSWELVNCPINKGKRSPPADITDGDRFNLK